jgi:hypothetical protein
MPIPFLGSILDIGDKLIDRLIPDPKANADAKQKLMELQQSGDLAAMGQQAEINKIEAANPDRFISGWRPAVGWVCAAGLAMAYILGPAVMWISAIVAWTHGRPFTAPVVDMATLMPVLMAMLGMAGLRTYEKTKDVEKNR